MENPFKARCPYCKGTGKQSAETRELTIQFDEVGTCLVCRGKGYIPWTPIYDLKVHCHMKWFKFREYLKDWWWSTGIPGRGLFKQIVEGTLSNLTILGEQSVKLRQDWQVMDLEARKKEFCDIVVKEQLSGNSNREVAEEHAKFYLGMLLDSNPNLELDEFLFWMVVSYRMERLDRKKRHEAYVRKMELRRLPWWKRTFYKLKLKGKTQ